MSDTEKQTTPVQRMNAVLGGGTVMTTVLGCAAAVAGAIAGLVLAMHRTVIQCTGDTYIENGADPNCYSYYDAARGVSIMFASLALLALILLVARVLFVVQAPRLPAEPSADPD